MGEFLLFLEYCKRKTSYEPTNATFTDIAYIKKKTNATCHRSEPATHNTINQPITLLPPLHQTTQIYKSYQPTTYLPPRRHHIPHQDFMRLLRRQTPVIIAGDLNARHRHSGQGRLTPLDETLYNT
ncbi:hypothetical protein E2C01_065112 [Portunus trituberculatus]|uniref:Endonuclease/exonuclease/phosphatase domain-containing protein n=1 Tax=Portunus trituberculatus TaxID=210409 RepID=A0A5B7HDL9_PORTR|nr:hypothetical protein [Portunus trituberculatus]